MELYLSFVKKIMTESITKKHLVNVRTILYELTPLPQNIFTLTQDYNTINISKRLTSTIMSSVDNLSFNSQIQQVTKMQIYLLLNIFENDIVKTDVSNLVMELIGSVLHDDFSYLNHDHNNETLMDIRNFLIKLLFFIKTVTIINYNILDDEDMKIIWPVNDSDFITVEIINEYVQNINFDVIKMIFTIGTSDVINLLNSAYQTIKIKIMKFMFKEITKKDPKDMSLIRMCKTIECHKMYDKIIEYHKRKYIDIDTNDQETIVHSLMTDELLFSQIKQIIDLYVDSYQIENTKLQMKFIFKYGESLFDHKLFMHMIVRFCSFVQAYQQKKRITIMSKEIPQLNGRITYEQSLKYDLLNVDNYHFNNIVTACNIKNILLHYVALYKCKKKDTVTSRHRTFKRFDITNKHCGDTNKHCNDDDNHNQQTNKYRVVKPSESLSIKSKRERQNKGFRRLVWIKYIGEHIGMHECFAKCGNMISQFTFECGHVVPRGEGGPNTVNNMRPICNFCNNDMGCMNMNDYIKELHPDIDFEPYR